MPFQHFTLLLSSVFSGNINPFVPNGPFLYLLKTSENRFLMFSEVEKGCIWNKWVNLTITKSYERHKSVNPQGLSLKFASGHVLRKSDFSNFYFQEASDEARKKWLQEKSQEIKGLKENFEEEKKEIIDEWHDRVRYFVSVSIPGKHLSGGLLLYHYRHFSEDLLQFFPLIYWLLIFERIHFLFRMSSKNLIDRGKLGFFK